MSSDEFCYTDFKEEEWASPGPQARWGILMPLERLEEMWQIPSREIEACEAVRDLKSIEERFTEQADKWQRETGHLSSPNQRIMHPSYQAILGMAQEHKQEMIRLMLQDLQKNRRSWFWALSYLTHDNPIGPSESGKFDKMTAAWVKWGRMRGLL
jgi:hypothetical protein